eukprot:Hpha_TRINITY_DN12985_c1_g1::TRINITY_DN12985_c1_g1_i1::g.164536::m.164536/K08515/VAMP7; vesicle-associated membrane protein 7
MAAVSAKEGIIYATISTKRTPASPEATILVAVTGDTVVCTSMDGLAPRFLSKISVEKSTKSSYSYEKVQFHLVVDENVCYMCVAEESLGRRIPYGFLEKIKTQFKDNFASSWHRVRDMSEKDCRSFEPVMKRQMKASVQDDLFVKNQKEIEETSRIMQQNIDDVLSRGEKIDILVERADDLQGETTQFKRRAKDLRCEMLKRRIMWTVAVTFLLGILILIICMIACDPNFKKCK